MRDAIPQLLTYIRGAWRFRWYAQLVAWPLCIGGLLLVHLLPNQYEVTARVFVDTQSILRPLLQGLAVQTNPGEQVQMLIRTLVSRPNLEKIARSTDLDLRAKTPEDLDALLAKLNKKIVMSNTGGRDGIFSISYADSDPQMAHRVVQSLVTLFVENSLGDTRKDSTTAQQFIDDQILEYETKLLAAEDRLKEFKRKNVSVMPNAALGYYERLQGEIIQLERAKLELNEAVNRRDELQRQLSGEVPTFGLVPRPSTPLGVTPPSVSPLDARLRTMEARLDELLLRYTDQHPDVIELSRQIEELRERDRKRQATAPQAMPSEVVNLDAAMAANPVYQRLKGALGEAEAEIASLRVRVNEYQNRVNQLRNLVDIVPQVEAELARLNRDYSINKQNFESLITRRESAKISQEAEQSDDSLRFKIVDPPRVPLTPVGPKRVLFATAVLGGSIVLGVLFAFFLAQIKPTFYSSRDVIDVTQTPVLGYVSMVWTDRERLRNRIGVISYLFAASGLWMAYGGFLASQMMAGHAIN